MNPPVTPTLNKRIGMGARLGRNTGVAFSLLFGSILSLCVSLIVQERTREHELTAFPVVSIAASEIGSGERWTDIQITYPDGRTEVVRQDVRIQEGSETTIYMDPNDPTTLQLREPSVSQMVSRSLPLLAFASFGCLFGLFLVARATVIKWDAKNTQRHGVPYIAKVTHIGTVWLPGSLNFIGYVKWQDTGGKTARSMTLTIKESDQFSVGDTVAVRAGSKRDWLVAELDLL